MSVNVRLPAALLADERLSRVVSLSSEPIGSTLARRAPVAWMANLGSDQSPHVLREREYLPRRY
jgi:hypothetical protein